MKIGIIPDVHGSSNWKNSYNKIRSENVDKIVFLGDYVDSHNDKNKGLIALNNLKEIMSEKDANPNLIDLLVGNHEFENYWFGYGRCSGFQMNCYEAYHNFFTSNLKKFKIAVKYDDWVFSHAGFSANWVDDVKKLYTQKFGNYALPEDPVEFSNLLLWSKNVTTFEFSDKDYSCCGDSIFASPLWIRPNSLLKSAYYKNQVVGHTPVGIDGPLFITEHGNNIILVDSADNNLYYILDTENPPTFLSTQENDKIQKRKLKEENTRRSLDGEKYKKLRDKYSLSKSDINNIKLKVQQLKEEAELKLLSDFDWWETVENLCRGNK